jgi:hypothetical protein
MTTINDQIEIKRSKKGFQFIIRKGKVVKRIGVTGKWKEQWHLAQRMLLDAHDPEYGICQSLTIVPKSKNYQKFLAMF